MSFFIKLGIHISHSERMDPIEFGEQGSKVKVTIDKYGNKLVNKIETKPLCTSSSNLVYIQAIVRDKTHFGGQMSKIKVTIDIYTYIEISL